MHLLNLETHKNLKLFQSITLPKNLVWQTQSVLQQSPFSAWIHYKTKLTILYYFLVRLFFLLGVVQCVSQPITPTCSHPNLQTNLMENQIYVNRLPPPYFFVIYALKEGWMIQEKKYIFIVLFLNIIILLSKMLQFN